MDLFRDDGAHKDRRKKNTKVIKRNVCMNKSKD